MRMSNLFGKTLRDMPGDADTVSHQLLLKAGMIHQIAAGIYHTVGVKSDGTVTAAGDETELAKWRL